MKPTNAPHSAATQPTAAPATPADAVEVSIVMPCLNEKDTIGECVRKARLAIETHNLRGEVIVADNGSTDGSIEIARAGGATVVHQPLRGYGAAYLMGVRHARGRYIIIGDSDDTYDFADSHLLLERLRSGVDVVLGSRFMGNILPGAMPWPNRYLGNPILTTMLNVLFGQRISDAHSGLRGFTREAWQIMDLRTTGMEFASEMLIKASLRRLSIAEIPITYHPRLGDSKLNRIEDAWRHIRFMMLFSPGTLFVLPGLVLLAIGLALVAVLVGGPFILGGVYIGVHYMVLGSLLSVLGLMLLTFGVSAKTYAFREHLVDQDRWIDALVSFFTLERGLLIGGALAAVGAVVFINILVQYLGGDRAPFNELVYLHQALAGATTLLIGMQIISASFFLSLLDIARQHSGPGE
ncbi:MAG: glycosyltransferase family 2 protein [Anaerolineales bacterium]|nr:glycosyltransferase family 2 protein [Anaerolineales bacterium]